MILDRYHRFKVKKLQKSFAKCGKNFRIGTNYNIGSFSMIEIGNNVSIGPNAILYSIYKKIIIGNNVLFGPGVTLVSGDHSIRKIGVTIIDNHEKMPGDDADIIIEDDVWVGANVTILKGVTIGRGSVLAAGAVVTKSTPPYSIAGGVPARVIGYRFNKEQIKKHESILYKESDRTPESRLEYLDKYNDYE